MKRNYLTGRRGRKRLPQWVFTVEKHDRRIARLKRKIKLLKRKVIGVVRIGRTPWIEELKRQHAETGKNPLEGAHCFEFQTGDGTIHRAACLECGTPATTIRPERRMAEERRTG